MAAVVEEWLELESDPGLFTMLLENIGVKGVQVEDIYDLTEEIKEEVFGFVFLFKWRDESKKNKRSQFSINENTKSNGVCNVNSSKNVLYETDLEKLTQIYFAHQVIPNSCATNALLSVLMNCHERINLGSVLNKFRDMTINMSPEKRGLALGNMPELADAHNKRARYLRSDNHNNNNNINSLYHSVATSLNTPSTRSLFNENDQEADETYHFVSYLPIGDGLYELDGLQPYPIKHSVIENENWTKICLNIIRNRMQQKSDHYSLMAVVRDRRKVLADQLSVLNKNRSVLQQALVQMEQQQQHQQNDLVDQLSSSGTVKKEGDSVGMGIDNGSNNNNNNHDDPQQKFGASDLNAGEISSNNSESSGKFNNGKIKTRTSSRVSMRNQRKMETLKKNTAEINVTPNDDSRSEVSNIILKNEERINANTTSLDILKPISIDITPINSSSVDQTSLDTLTSSTNSGRSNRNSSKYPTRSSTKRDTLASNSLAYSRSNTSPNQTCETELSTIDFKFPTFSPDQLKHLMQVVDDTIKNCKSKMSDEIEKRKKYITDDMRRSFNYDDFIHAFLFALKKQGLLEKLLEEQRQKLISKKPTKRPYRSSTTSKRLKLITNQDSTLSRTISKKSLSMRKRVL